MMASLTDADRKRKHYEANRVRYAEQSGKRYASNKEAYAKRVKTWQQRNKNKRNFAARKREQHLLTINELLPGEWEQLVEQCENRCIVAGCGASPVTKDHVIPLIKGGRHHVSNLQPLCLSCNASKGAKEIDYRVLVP